MNGMLWLAAHVRRLYRAPLGDDQEALLDDTLIIRGEVSARCHPFTEPEPAD
jgi:hypothetical protein